MLAGLLLPAQPANEAALRVSRLSPLAPSANEVKYAAHPGANQHADYMQRLAARPHHLGSPYDKDNAEWILTKLKSWGLDAKIETFEVLFPYAKDRALELLEPERFKAKLARAYCYGGLHLRQQHDNSLPTMPTRSTAT